jgi:hypothetical protein
MEVRLAFGLNFRPKPPFRKFRLTHFHKIDIFQSGIHRVAAQIFLRFQGEKAVRRKLS